jgi:serine/threonine protein kinase
MSIGKIIGCLIASSLVFMTSSQACSNFISYFPSYSCVSDASIGAGAFGSVFLVSKDGNQYIMKVAKKISDSPSDQESFILKKIQDGKYIINLFENYQTTLFDIMILEFGQKGSLTSFRSKEKEQFTKLDFTLNLLFEIISGVNVVHEKGFIWADLKPDNIIMTTGDHSKLIDFGISVPKNTYHGGSGTPAFIDPTFFVIPGPLYTSAVDIYSFGVSVYALYFNYLPFSNLLDIVNEVQVGTFRIPAGMPKTLVSIIDGCMKYEPTERISVAEILELIQKGQGDEKNQVIDSNYYGSLKQKLDFGKPASYIAFHWIEIMNMMRYIFTFVFTAVAVIGPFKGIIAASDKSEPILTVL